MYSVYHNIIFDHLYCIGLGPFKHLKYHVGISILNFKEVCNFGPRSGTFNVIFSNYRNAVELRIVMCPFFSNLSYIKNLTFYIKQSMYSFEVNIRICQPQNRDVHQGEAQVNITFEG